MTGNLKLIVREVCFSNVSKIDTIGVDAIAEGLAALGSKCGRAFVDLNCNDFDPSRKLTS